MIDAIKSTHAETITVKPTATRQTPPDGSESFGQALAQGAKVLLGAAGTVAGFLPGGGILSAAVRTTAEGIPAAQEGTVTGQDPRTPATTQMAAPDGSGSELDDLRSMQQEGMRTNMELLEIQQAVSRETRVYSTLSNVLKARHDTARNAIGNIR